MPQLGALAGIFQAERKSFTPSNAFGGGLRGFRGQHRGGRGPVLASEEPGSPQSGKRDLADCSLTQYFKTM